MSDTTATAPAIGAVSRLAAPLCLALLIDAGTQLAIVSLFGHMDNEALYVRSLYLPVAFLLLSLQEGLGISTQVIFARLRGRGNHTAAATVMARIVSVGIATYILVAVLIGALVPLLADLLRVPPEHLDTFVGFTRLMVFVSIGTVPVSVSIAALRGWGRPGVSLNLSLLFAGTQILGVWTAGSLFSMGIMSLPLFVLIASGVSLTLVPQLLKRTGIISRRRDLVSACAGLCRRSHSGREGANDGDASIAVRPMLIQVGIPVALSYALLMLANFVTLIILTPFGPDTQAAFGATSTTQTLVIVPAIGLASATAVIMNQDIGAERTELLPTTFRAASLIVIIGYAALSVLLYLTTSMLVRLLVGEPSVRIELDNILSIVAPSMAGLGIVLFLVTLLEQLGAGVLAVVLNLLYYIGSLGIGGTIAHMTNQPEGLYITLAVSNAVGALVVFPITIAIVRRRAGVSENRARGRRNESNEETNP